MFCCDFILQMMFSDDDLIFYLSHLSYLTEVKLAILACTVSLLTVHEKQKWLPFIWVDYDSLFRFTLCCSSLIVILGLNLLLLNCWYTQITKRHILYITANFWLYLPRFLPSFWYNRGELNIILFIESVLCMIGLFHSHNKNNKN